MEHFGGENRGKNSRMWAAGVGHGLLFFYFPQRREGENRSGVCCIPFRLNSNLLLAFYIFPSADYVCRLKVPYLRGAPARVPRADPEGRYRLHGVLITRKSHSLGALYCVFIYVEALGLALLIISSSVICIPARN